MSRVYYHEKKLKGRFATHHIPAEFKPMGLPQVKGGRWRIRRKLLGDRPWRAWSDGRAKRWNRSFPTHAEAVAWATLVAKTYATYKYSETADEYLREIRKREK